MMADVTRILNAIEQGDAGATEKLLPLVYEVTALSPFRMANMSTTSTPTEQASLELAILEERRGINKRVFVQIFKMIVSKLENSCLFKVISVRSLMSYREIMFFKRVNGKSQITRKL